MNNRTYQTINIADLGNIDFSQVLETSADTIRKSIDETLFTIKWTTEPSFITDETVIPLGTYNHAEILELMNTDAWNIEYDLPELNI